jgi:hypothetical protein
LGIGSPPVTSDNFRLRLRSLRSPPPPDSPEGRTLIFGIVVGAAYVLLLVGAASGTVGLSLYFVPLVLILGTLVSLAVGLLLDADFARIRLTELELARMITARGKREEVPEVGSPTGDVMEEYARTAIEFRRHARSHAYASGPVVAGTLLALGAALLWGVGWITAATWVIELGLVVELPAVILLVVGVAVLGAAIGSSRAVTGFDALTISRWCRYEDRTPAVDAAVSTILWLDEYVQAAQSAADR